MSEEIMTHREDGFKQEIQIIIPTEAFSDYAGHPLVRQAYLTDVGFYPHAEGHYKERPDGTDSCILFYCLSGSGTIEVSPPENEKHTEKYRLGVSQAFCIPAGMPHRYYSDSEDPWSILWVHCKGESLQYYPIGTPQVVQMNSPERDRRIQSLFQMLFNTLERNYTYTLGSFIYLSQILSLILTEIFFHKDLSETTQQNRHVTAVIRYMYRHLHENLTLDDISEEVQLSKSYLNNIFRASTQRSTMDFFLNLKMQEACKLLRMENSFVYEVASTLGYSDPYYFSRLFTKIIGVSPKEYRNRLNG